MDNSCALCLQSRQFRKSHIIPEFMYENLYDSDPKRFYSLTVNVDDEAKSRSKVEQKGVRENLLCADCEILLSKYEKYAAETIYAKNRHSKVILFNGSETLDKRLFLYEFKGFSYKDFKLFAISLAWRLMISKAFPKLSIGEEIKEQLRDAILKEDPMNFDDFGCLVQIIKYDKDKLVSGFIMNPYLTTSKEGVKLLNILIDGMMYSFYLSKGNVPENISEHFLQHNGYMNIMGRLIYDDATLFENLKKAYRFFDEKAK